MKAGWQNPAMTVDCESPISYSQSLARPDCLLFRALPKFGRSLMASQTDWRGLFAAPPKPEGLFAPPEQMGGLFAPPEQMGGLFAPQMRPLDGLPSMGPYNPTLRERVGNAVYDFFSWAGLNGEQARRDALAVVDFVPGLSEAVGSDEAARDYRAGRYLDAALGTGGVVLGMAVPPARPLRRLPMDEASRVARAEAMGFDTDMPVRFGRAPKGETVASSAIKANGRIFTGRTHLEAVDKAEAELGIPLNDMELDPIADGFVTSAGRYISRREADDIARREGQGEAAGLFGLVHGLSSERLRPRASARRLARETGATAPGLRGGSGVWGVLPREPAEAAEANLLWHRAERRGQFEARGLEDHEIQATLQNAWEAGFDAAIIRNYTTPDGKTVDVIVVKDPAQLRAPKARFDPKKRNSADLLAGLGGAAVVVGVAASQEKKQK
jgi:hypothetical protein